MGKASRAKGARGELQVRDLLRPLWPSATRGVGQSQSGDNGADVEGTPYWVEVKLVKRQESPRAALRQAQAATDGRPPLVFSRCDREDWMVTMPASVALDLLSPDKDAQ